MTAAAPCFVVVGNVNQGKSSVVAALAEDPAIPIDSYPGTTRRSAEYAFRSGDDVLFRIVDTPGFQDARRALAWLQARARSPDQRRRAVAAFVEQHRGSEDFADEVELLAPILAGAGVLYVVDASTRFQPHNEAEMEVLRWTGQPGMALLNRTGPRDHTEEWRSILEQFFNIVRTFDAHGAGFADRVDLLRGFREIRAEWRGGIDRAVAAMESGWHDRRRRAAATIAGLIVDVLAHVAKRPLREGADEQQARTALAADYLQAIREMEQRARRAVERIYGHDNPTTEAPLPALLREDLFSATSWQLFGLERSQLTLHAAAWGAAIGTGVGIAAAGPSFFIGTVIGGLVGGGGVWFAGTQVARVWQQGSRLGHLLFPGETGRFLAMGPVSNPAFAWVLIDRALTHFRVVRDRSHARQDAEQLDEAPARGTTAHLPKPARDPVHLACRQIVDAARRGEVPGTVRAALTASIDAILQQLPPARERA